MSSPRVSAHEAGATRLLFAPSGAEVLTGGSDAKVNVFEFGALITRDRPVRSYTESSEGITCFEFDGNVKEGTRFAVGAQDGVVVLYEGGAHRQVFRQAACVVHACSFSPCGKRLAVASDNGLRIISTQPGCTDATEISSPLQSREAVLTAKWLPSNVLVAAGTSGIAAWDVSGPTPVHKKMPKPFSLTQTRQRNETVALNLPPVVMYGSEGFAFPKGNQVVLQPIGGTAVFCSVPDLPEGKEVLLVVTSVARQVLICLDEVGYFTSFDMRTRKVISHIRPVLGSANEEVCDFAFHPNAPGTIVTTTSLGMLHVIAGAYVEPDNVTTKAIDKKAALKPEKEKEEEEGEDEHDDESSARAEHMMDDEAEEGEEDESIDMKDVDDHEALDEIEMEMGMSDARGEISIGARQASFQIGQSPRPQYPDVENTRILCWNRIGLVRLGVPDRLSVSISFYDKASYSAVRFLDKADPSIAPLTMAALGRRCCVFASSDATLTNRLLYRALQSWGTNTEWTRVFEMEVPVCLAVGDTWVACFTNRYLRLFTHTGVHMSVVSLSVRPVCCTGIDSGLPPSSGDIPLKHNLANLLAFVVDDGQQLKLKVWDVPAQVVVDDDIPLALSEHSSLLWMGWTDEGMIATQDSVQVIRVLTHAFGRSWVPVFDPKASRVFENYHIISVRGQQVTAIPVTANVGPDPRIEEHQQVTKPLQIPVHCGQQWTDKEAAVMQARLVLTEKKHRAEHYTADIAKLELKQDAQLMALFKEAITGRQASTARALDLARLFNMKDRLEKAMAFAYTNKETQLYEKMRIMLEGFGPKQTRRTRLPNKPPKTKGSTTDEKLENLARKVDTELLQIRKDITSRPQAAEAKRVEPTATAPKAQKPQATRPLASSISSMKSTGFFATAPTTQEEPLDVEGALQYIAPADTPLPQSQPPAPRSPRKRKAPEPVAAQKKVKKNPVKPTAKPAKPAPKETKETKAADDEAEWWHVDGGDDVHRGNTGVIDTTQVEQEEREKALRDAQRAPKKVEKPAPEKPATSAPKTSLASPFAAAPSTPVEPVSQVFSAVSQESQIIPFLPLPTPTPPAAVPEPQPTPPKAEKTNGNGASKLKNLMMKKKPVEKDAGNDGAAKLKSLMMRRKTPAQTKSESPKRPIPVPEPAEPKYLDGTLKEVTVPERATTGLANDSQVSSDLGKAKEMARLLQEEDEEEDEEDTMPMIKIGN